MAEMMAEVRAAALDCRACRLADTRTNVVFGVGNEQARVMFIGEGPGEREDVEGRPFVGRSGHLLDDMMSMVGLDRTKVYIANIVKCRPPKNRDPLGVEQDACIGWLRRQVKVIQPKLIVCLGRVAAQKLIKDDLRITQEHGLWFEKGNFLMMATFHPAALLRNPNNRPEAFEDFDSLRRKIEQVCERTAL